jgi:hypothetical protein
MGWPFQTVGGVQTNPAKEYKKGDCSSWRRSDIAGRLCRATYETVHRYESIHSDQMDR